MQLNKAYIKEQKTFFTVIIRLIQQSQFLFFIFLDCWKKKQENIYSDNK